MLRIYHISKAHHDPLTKVEQPSAQCFTIISEHKKTQFLEVDHFFSLPGGTKNNNFYLVRRYIAAEKLYKGGHFSHVVKLNLAFYIVVAQYPWKHHS